MTPPGSVLYLRTQIVAFVWLLVSISACALPFSDTVRHEGFSVALPSDWIDFTSPETESLNIGSKWELGYLVVGKLPGGAPSLLDLYQSNTRAAHSDTEERLSEWHQFKGHGFRFRRLSPSGDILKETVLFYPEGDLAGYYIHAGFATARTGAKQEFERVIETLQREKLLR